MSEVATVKSYVKQVIAKLKGDESEVVAEKNFRKAVSSVKQQIGGLENKQVDLESSLEEAQERLDNAKYPTTLISNSQSFTQSIATAQERVDNAQAELDATKKSITFFKGLLTEFEA
jgi:prefoldin subunit 5